jgi:hypothetical protein
MDADKIESALGAAIVVAIGCKVVEAVLSVVVGW